MGIITKKTLFFLPPLTVSEHYTVFLTVTMWLRGACEACLGACSGGACLLRPFLGGFGLLEVGTKTSMSHPPTD